MVFSSFFWSHYKFTTYSWGLESLYQICLSIFGLSDYHMLNKTLFFANGFWTSLTLRITYLEHSTHNQNWWTIVLQEGKWILVWTTKISPKHATTKAIPITSPGSYIVLSNSRSLQLLEGTYKSLEEFKSIVSLLCVSFGSNSRTENTHTNAPCESRPPRSLLMKQKHVKSATTP
jgi:hypothetical protein